MCQSLHIVELLARPQLLHTINVITSLVIFWPAQGCATHAGLRCVLSFPGSSADFNQAGLRFKQEVGAAVKVKPAIGAC